MPLILNGTTGVSGVDGSAGTPSYQGNDTNTGVFFPAADVIAFSTNGTEDARFDSAGNFGIGTTSPSGSDWNASATVVQVSKNDTNGGLFKATSSNTNFIFSAGNNLAYVATTTNTPITFFTNTTERMRIDSSGRVGINTNSPSQLLQVASTTSDPYILIGGTAARDCGILMNATNQFTALRADGANRLFVGAGTELRFLVSGGSTEAMRIDSSGRVTTPFQPNATVGRATTGWTTLDTVIWNVVHSNTGNHYNASNGTFTCPVAGDYLVSLMVMSNDQNVTMDIELRRNGTTAQQFVPYQAETGGSYNQVSGLTVITCAANDTLTIKLNSGSIFGGGNGRHSSVVFRLIG